MCAAPLHARRALGQPPHAAAARSASPAAAAAVTQPIAHRPERHATPRATASGGRQRASSSLAAGPAAGAVCSSSGAQAAAAAAAARGAARLLAAERRARRVRLSRVRADLFAGTPFANAPLLAYSYVPHRALCSCTRHWAEEACRAILLRAHFERRTESCSARSATA